MRARTHPTNVNKIPRFNTLPKQLKEKREREKKERKISFPTYSTTSKKKRKKFNFIFINFFLQTLPRSVRLKRPRAFCLLSSAIPMGSILLEYPSICIFFLVNQICAIIITSLRYIKRPFRENNALNLLLMYIFF